MHESLKLKTRFIGTVIIQKVKGKKSLKFKPIITAAYSDWNFLRLFNFFSNLELKNSTVIGGVI